MHYYHVQEFVYSGDFVKTYNGTISDAKSPKEAVKNYLLYYCYDRETINKTKRTTQKTGCNFIVTDCSNHRRGYFIIM